MNDAAAILEIATDHVGAGKLSEKNIQRLSQLDTMLGDSCRFEGGHLWRALCIDGALAEQLRARRAVDIPIRQYSCWSRDPLALMNVARHRFTSMETDQEFMMIRTQVPGNRAGIDVEAIFRSLGETDSLSWNRYAGREREVILRHDEPALNVAPEMVTGLWRADEYEAIAPRVGETFFGGGNDILHIDEVIRPENGGYVVVSAGEQYMLHWEYGELDGLPYEAAPDMPGL